MLIFILIVSAGIGVLGISESSKEKENPKVVKVCRYFAEHKTCQTEWREIK